MTTFTTCRIADPFGVHLAEIATYTKLHYVLNCAPGAVGVLELTLPATFDRSLLRRDGRIGIWNSINGRPPALDNGAIYLMETFEYTRRATFVRAYHATALLDRRIIAYDAGSSYSSKSSAAADNQIKAFASQQLGSGIVGADRDGVETQADVSAYLSIQANLSQGASVAKSAARRRLLDVARELAEASTTAGTYLTFEIVAPTENTLELRTYATQRGVDRRIGTTQPVILSESRGNLENATLLIDYHDECTFAIAGGSGEKSDRLIATTMDATRAATSPFGRIERFFDMSNVDDLTSLQDDADAGVRNGRPIVLFTGDLVETPKTTRGIHFDLGDMLTAEHVGQQFDVRLDVLSTTIDASGRRVQCGLRSVT